MNLKMGYGGYGRRGGRGGGGRGRWPGNGPFSHLPPWERPGWLYGPGSCWSLGYWNTAVGSSTAAAPVVASNIQTLQQQKDMMEAQLKSLQETLSRIEERMKELEQQ